MSNLTYLSQKDIDEKHAKETLKFEKQEKKSKNYLKFFALFAISEFGLTSVLAFFNVLPSISILLSFVFCFIFLIAGYASYDITKPYKWYSYKYQQLDNEQKLAMVEFLKSHSEVQEYNAKRMEENRPWLQMDYLVINHFVKNEKLKTVDVELNKNYLDENKKARYLTTAL